MVRKSLTRYLVTSAMLIMVYSSADRLHLWRITMKINNGNKQMYLANLFYKILMTKFPCRLQFCLECTTILQFRVEKMIYSQYKVTACIQHFAVLSIAFALAFTCPDPENGCYQQDIVRLSKLMSFTLS